MIDEIVTRLDSVDIGNAFHDDIGFQDNSNYAQNYGGDDSSLRQYWQKSTVVRIRKIFHNNE